MAAMAVPPPAIPAQLAATPPTSPGQVFPNSSLYVGNLEASVDETKLYDLFNQVAPVVSIRICRDQTRRASLGYAYVNFSTFLDGDRRFPCFTYSVLCVKSVVACM